MCNWASVEKVSPSGSPADIQATGSVLFDIVGTVRAALNCSSCPVLRCTARNHHAAESGCEVLDTLFSARPLLRGRQSIPTQK